MNMDRLESTIKGFTNVWLSLLDSLFCLFFFQAWSSKQLSSRYTRETVLLMTNSTSPGKIISSLVDGEHGDEIRKSSIFTKVRELYIKTNSRQNFVPGLSNIAQSSPAFQREPSNLYQIFWRRTSCSSRLICRAVTHRLLINLRPPLGPSLRLLASGSGVFLPFAVRFRRLFRSFHSADREFSEPGNSGTSPSFSKDCRAMQFSFAFLSSFPFSFSSSSVFLCLFW